MFCQFPGNDAGPGLHDYTESEYHRERSASASTGQAPLTWQKQAAQVWESTAHSRYRVKHLGNVYIRTSAMAA